MPGHDTKDGEMPDPETTEEVETEAPQQEEPTRVAEITDDSTVTVEAESSRSNPTQADIDKAYDKLRRAEAERDRLASEIKKREDAEKSELERAESRVAELEQAQANAAQKLRQAKLLSALSRPDLGIAPDAVDLVAEKLDVEFDSEDDPIGVDEAVSRFLDARPSFRAAPALGSSSPANGAKERSGGKELTREEVRELAKENPTRFNEMWERGEIPASALG